MLNESRRFNLDEVIAEARKALIESRSSLTRNLEWVGARTLDSDRFVVIYRASHSVIEYGVVLSAKELSEQYERPTSALHLALLAIEEIAEPSGPHYTTTSNLAGSLSRHPKLIRWRGLDPNALDVKLIVDSPSNSTSAQPARYSGGWTSSRTSDGDDPQ